MTNFDPFFSTQYQRCKVQDFDLQTQPNLSKQSESQFISDIWSNIFSGPRKENTEHTSVNMIQERQSQNSKIQECSNPNSSSQNSQKKSLKNSPFHNFQKHLLITLRQILTIQPLSIKYGEEYELARKIFDHFKKSSKTSRQYLQHVFGLVQVVDSKNNSNYEKILRKGQLEQIFSEYSYETIISAQNILKQFTKLQLDQCDLKECLKGRKIQKKDEFIAYINLFKTQLINGKQRKKTYKLLAKKFNEKKQQIIEVQNIQAKYQCFDSDFEVQI